MIGRPGHVWSSFGPGAVVLMLALLFLWSSRGTAGPGGDTNPEGPERQVTIFGIEASATNLTTDPKLVSIAPQLLRLRPDNGFRLRAVKSRRILPGQTSTCALGNGLEAEAKLLSGETSSGKFRIGFTLRKGQRVEFTKTVITPANQPFFCDHPLPNGTRLLIGIGVR